MNAPSLTQLSATLTATEIDDDGAYEHMTYSLIGNGAVIDVLKRQIMMDAHGNTEEYATLLTRGSVEWSNTITNFLSMFSEAAEVTVIGRNNA